MDDETPRIDGPPGAGDDGPDQGRVPNPNPSRYTVIERIARGGMGEVWRLQDHQLERTLALKVMHPSLAGHATSRERFRTESRVTARLDHPGIIPVLDAGETPEGRLWYLMREVGGGTTLRPRLDIPRREGVPDPIGLRAAVEAIQRVAQTLAHAHARGVVHRDLKPDNVLLGRHGEVIVLDWGLALELGRAGGGAATPARSPFDGGGDRLTRAGRTMGTVPYLSPEQARGEIRQHGPTCDVWALGILLYEALVGELPYRGRPAAMLATLITTPPPPLPEASESGLSALVAGCTRLNPRDRPAHAGEVADALSSWLDGSTRRVRALEAVARADGLTPEIQRIEEDAAHLRDEAYTLLAALPRGASVERKRPAWALEDAAERREIEAAVLEVTREQALRAAMDHDPGAPEPRQRIADLTRVALVHAEEQRDRRGIARASALLEAHDPTGAPAFLSGRGALSLDAHPDGAEIQLHRLVLRDRRLTPQPEGRPIHAPLRRLPLDRGSWLLRVSHPLAEGTWLPVVLTRGEHWDATAQGIGPLQLLPAGTLGVHDLHVPGGPAWFGGDSFAPDSLPRTRRDVPGFVVRRHPVTHREYMAFLDSLVAAGRTEEAQRNAPAYPAGRDDVPRPLYRQRPDGTFTCAMDENGFAIDRDEPVVLVDWRGACAFAAWEAARTGRPWRLPFEWEWEKAARGVDGRLLPWGDWFEPTWANTFESRDGPAARARVDDWPLDESVYGVRGLVGNVRDWCLDVWHPTPTPVGDPLLALHAEGPFRSQRGGAWSTALPGCRPAARFASPPGRRLTSVGLRLFASAEGWGDQPVTGV